MNNVVAIPLEFKIACEIIKVDIHKILQAFIDHVSFLQLYSDRYVERYSEASIVIISYIKGKEQLLGDFNSFHHLTPCEREVMDKIISIIQAKDYSEAKQRNKAAACVKRFDGMIDGEYIDSDKVKIQEHAELSLTRDFRLTCQLYHVFAFEYLEYFMNNISLAEMIAMESLGIQIVDPAQLFFISLFNKKRLLDVMTLETGFLKSFVLLREECSKVDSLDDRIILFKSFFNSYFKYVKSRGL